jgi:hypothetical protein
MSAHRILAGAFAGAIVASAIFAQIGNVPVVIPPNFSVSLHASFLTASGESMAADRFGNVYIVDQGNVIGTGSVTKVQQDGTVVPQFVSNVGALSQVTYNPADGYCYIASWSPLLPVVLSNVFRIDPVQGAVQVSFVSLIASGYSIDNAGLMYFGTQTGLSGPGLYSHDPNGPGGNFTFLSTGFAQNAILQTLFTGDVLIGGLNEVRRWVPSSVAPVPYYTHPPPLPNAVATVNSIARTPFNQIGAGALIGVREFGTLCLCGQGLTITAGLTGLNPQTFASEQYGSPFLGLRCVASGLFQDEWWYTEQPGPGPIAGKLLWRIQQTPAHSSQGSLITSVAANVVTIDIYGPPTGGDPFLFGGASAILPVSLSQFVPPFGIVDLFPFHALYTPILDGLGLFGPPNPFAQIPAGGHFQVAVVIPPGLTGIALNLQELTVSPGVAPNGLFFISNVELLVLP